MFKTGQLLWVGASAAAHSTVGKKKGKQCLWEREIRGLPHNQSSEKVINLS
jgi:hypothetical protein